MSIERKPAPPLLFKYSPDDTKGYTLHSLENRYWHFSSPLSFNDPYDCSIVPSFTDLTDQELVDIRRAYIARTHDLKDLNHAFRTKSADDLRVLFAEKGRDAIVKAAKIQAERIGVCCFSEMNDNLLMWGHYASKYSGLCLEFRTEFVAPDKLKNVNYAKEIPKIELSRVLPTRTKGLDIDWDYARDVVRILFCLKAESWSYEKEWRAIHERSMGTYYYHPESLAGVYFGPRASSDFQNRALQILRKINSPARVFKGRKSLTEFKIEFDEFSL